MALDTEATGGRDMRRRAWRRSRSPSAFRLGLKSALPGGMSMPENNPKAGGSWTVTSVRVGGLAAK